MMLVREPFCLCCNHAHRPASDLAEQRDRIASLLRTSGSEVWEMRPVRPAETSASHGVVIPKRGPKTHTYSQGNIRTLTLSLDAIASDREMAGPQLHSQPSRCRLGVCVCVWGLGYHCSVHARSVLGWVPLCYVKRRMRSGGKGKGSRSDFHALPSPAKLNPANFA